jgi:hypothetical protein
MMCLTQIRLAIPALLLATCLGGCASGRLQDLRDCGRVSIGYGLGIGVEAGLGIVGNPSLGAGSDKIMFGFENRGLAGSWSEGELFWPRSVHLFEDETNAEFHVFAPYARQIGSGPFGPSLRYPIKRYRNLVFAPSNTAVWDPVSRFQSMTDWEIGATLGVVSFRFGVNPLEVLDFVLGFVGLDIGRDDPKKQAEARASGDRQIVGEIAEARKWLGFSRLRAQNSAGRRDAGSPARPEWSMVRVEHGEQP